MPRKKSKNVSMVRKSAGVAEKNQVPRKVVVANPLHALLDLASMVS